MASSVLVMVGECGDLLERVVETAGGLRLGSGLDPSTGMCALVTASHKKKVERYIEIGVEEGQEVLTGEVRPSS